MIENTGNLSTETRNNLTNNLDQLETKTIIELINQEDQKVALAVKEQLANIDKAIEMVVKHIKAGGRLIYFGAGTSGRLGVLDASECPPTYSTTTEVQGIIAGGDKAMRNAVEGAEDSKELAIEDLKSMNINSKDVMMGIAASGRTPYVIGGLEYARSLDCETIALSCNVNSKISDLANIAIEVNVGPEILTGSTRMKSGTAQKMVLNMISTTSMIKLGKVYGNMMVDVNPTNEKLIQRATRIVKEIAKCDEKLAYEKLVESQLKPKCAIVMIKRNCTLEEAKNILSKSDDFLRKAIEE